MSLAEIPHNHIRRNGQPPESSAARREAKLHAGPSNSDENADSLRKPSSIQSMLRNTTETGYVGQFSVKPSRAAVSSSGLSPASSKARSTPSKRRHAAPNYNGHYSHHGHRVPDSVRQGSTVSNGPGYHTQGRHGPHRMPSFEDYQSYSMPQSSYTGHNIHHFPNGHSRSGADLHNNRPHSPFAYPTRLKRPGYRPSSPALSEFNKTATGYGQRPAYDPSSRTTSPSSAYNTNRTPSPFRYVVDRSDPSMQYYPPYLGMEPKRYRSPSISSTRPSTPKPSTSLKSKASSTQVQRKTSIKNGNWLHPQASPVSPIFYDYTEEFEDQDNFEVTTTSSKLLSEQPVPQIESSTYSELDESPDGTEIAELPSETSPTKTKLQHYERAFNQSTIEIKMADDGFTQTAPQDLSDVPELPEKEMAATEAELPLKKNGHQWYKKAGRHSVIKSKSLPNVEIVQQLPLAIADRSQVFPHELAADSAALGVLQASDQESKSPDGSMFSAKSSIIPQPEVSTPEPIYSPVAALPTQANPETPSNDFDRGNVPAALDRVRTLNSSRGPSFEGHSRLSTEILSPTPERSIISPSSRDRFSKILSIEESPLDLDMLAPLDSRDDRIDSPMQGTHSSQIRQIGTSGPLWRSGFQHVRNSPLQQSVVSGALNEKAESESEEEPELSVALRQTFCKSDEDALTKRTTSPPINLPSQLAGQQFTPPVLVRRSPAIRRSTTNVVMQPDQPHRASNKELASIERSATQVTPPNIITEPLAVDGKLPQLPRKQVSLRSFSPASEPNSSELPFDFIPLIHRPSEDDSAAESEAISSLTLRQRDLTPKEGVEPTLRLKPLVDPGSIAAQPNGLASGDEVNQVSASHNELRNNRDSATSPHASVGSRPGSRPWNLDSSYPWNDQVPELEVTMPQPTAGMQSSTEKVPRFKLKIQRASSSTGGTNKLKKELHPSDISRPSCSSSHDLINGPSFRRKRIPHLSIVPTQINSSHDIIQSSRQKTRFVEGFETRSPTISLPPPSPGYEVRSFFSDDSSQMRSKPSFIKRFSGYRARTAATRATSVDDTRGYDRGLLSSALGRSRASGRTSRQSRNTGRSSRQSQYTTGPSLRSSQARRTRWKMIDKIRTWLHRGEGRVRGLGWRMRNRREKDRSASAPLYTSA